MNVYLCCYRTRTSLKVPGCII